MKKRTHKDEHYVLDLCDKVLGMTAERQKTFDFLVGDPGKNGACVMLPVDGYYHHLKLVVEFREKQHSEPVKYFDKPHVLTISGVHRGEQRRIYDQRRRTVLPGNGLRLLEISYTDFAFNRRKKIIRDMSSDLRTVQKLIEKFLKS